jgi:hypothetical protein
LLCRAQGRTVQLRPLPFADLERHLELHRCPAPLSPQPDPAGALTEADELRIGAGPRREPLRPDVQRLEQVGLPRTVRSDDEHQPRFQVEVETSVRPNVPKRDRFDDQPGLA